MRYFGLLRTVFLGGRGADRPCQYSRGTFLQVVLSALLLAGALASPAQAAGNVSAGGSAGYVCGTAPKDYCNCSGTADCKDLRGSGMCSGPMACKDGKCVCLAARRAPGAKGAGSAASPGKPSTMVK